MFRVRCYEVAEITRVVRRQSRRVVPSCLHSPLSLARAAHQLCLGLPSMVLTQRLKKRNQSDSVLAESHNDEQKNDIHDVHQIQERQAKVLKKKKVRDT